MTSDTDYNLHEVDGPSEISRHVPLSDQRNRRKRPSPRRKQHPGKKPQDAGQAEQQETDDSTPESHTDHEIDYYA